MGLFKKKKKITCFFEGTKKTGKIGLADFEILKCIHCGAEYNSGCPSVNPSLICKNMIKYES